MRKLFVVIAAAGFAASAHAAPTPLHSFEFSGDYTDQYGGVSLAGNGGTFTGSGVSGGLTFGQNEGPTLSAGVNSHAYSIELFFELDTLGNYRKIVDFKNRVDDEGLYVSQDRLNFYNIEGGGIGINANEMIHVVLTRDADDQFAAYLNGDLVIDFTDLSDNAVFAGSPTIAHFFRDDLDTGGGEATGGFVDFIRIYDTALDASDVASLYNDGTPMRFTPDISTPVSEPAMAGVLGLGLIGAAALRRRRKG